ncbi:MAG: hypothetical protein NUW07_09865, partial [Candidatus Saccharicenans sp.]|nr:hypothetical protein [Candidatus Saccharicenans sp.]
MAVNLKIKNFFLSNRSRDFNKTLWVLLGPYGDKQKHENKTHPTFLLVLIGVIIKVWGKNQRPNCELLKHSIIRISTRSKKYRGALLYLTKISKQDNASSLRT